MVLDLQHLWRVLFFWDLVLSCLETQHGWITRPVQDPLFMMPGTLDTNMIRVHVKWFQFTMER